MKSLIFVLAVVAVLCVASSAEAGGFGRRLSREERAFLAGQQSVAGHCGVNNFGRFNRFGGYGSRGFSFRF